MMSSRICLFLRGSATKWLGRQSGNPEVAGLSPALTTQLELFTDRPQTNSSVMPVNRQLFYLPPVGIFILLCRQFFVLQFSGMSVNHLGVAKYIGLYKQQQFNILPIVSSMQRFFLLHHRIKFTAKCTVFIYRPFNPSSQPSDLCFAYKLFNSLSRSMFTSNLSLIHQRIPRKACCPWSLMIRESM